MSLHASVLVGCVVAHIALSPVLIFGWGPFPALGPAGAGWGLVVPFAFGSLIMILYLRSPGSIVRLNFRGTAPRWALFADILKVGVPGLVNTALTNLSIVILTGIAGQFGREAGLGYAMGARLEYVMQPIAFGFGTALVTMVGTNWGAGQYYRARQIAWRGALTIAAVCGTIGLIVAIEPSLWLNLFSNDPEVERFGLQYLRIVGPAYLCFGLGLGLLFASQGFGRGVAPMIANAVRLVVNAGAGVAAVYWLDLGVPGFCAAVSAGFAVYAALIVHSVLRIEDPHGSTSPLK